MSSGCIAVAGVVFIVAVVGVDVAKMFIGCTAVAGGVVVLLMIYIYVKSLQSHFILTMSHWSSGLTLCFPLQGTWIQIPRGVLM
jgi:hypothetical protein